MSRVILTERWRQRGGSPVRYIGGTTGGSGGGVVVVPSGAWTPNALVRNAPRVRAADDPGVVDWETYYQAGDTAADGSVNFQAVATRVPPGPAGHAARALSLPAGEFKIKDYLNGYYAGVQLGQGGAVNVNGVTGSGWDNTVIRPLVNGATRLKSDDSKPATFNADGSLKAAAVPATHGIAGTTMVIQGVSGARADNLAFRGAPMALNGLELYYGGLTFYKCPDSSASLYMRGADRGYGNSPPGEQFGLNVFLSDRFTLHDSELDNRDDAGNRWGSSPFGWNGTDGNALPNKGTTSTYVTDAKVLRTYAHHGVAGMPTFWTTRNIYTEDLWSYSTGSGAGSLSGSALNHEMWDGTVTHVRPYLFPHNASASGLVPPAPLPNDPVTQNNAGFHISFATTVAAPGQIQIIDPVFDKATSGDGLLAFVGYDNYGGYNNTTSLAPAPQIVRNGVTLARKDHPLSGWNRGDPAASYSWIH